MRFIGLGAAALLLMPATAFAGSVTTLTTGADGGSSITTLACQACATAPDAGKAGTIALSPGSQRIELKTVDGKSRLYRTENWLGGSPVTYVTTASDDQIARYGKKEDTDAGVEMAGGGQTATDTGGGTVITAAPRHGAKTDDEAEVIAPDADANAGTSAGIDREATTGAVETPGMSATTTLEDDDASGTGGLRLKTFDGIQN